MSQLAKHIIENRLRQGQVLGTVKELTDLLGCSAEDVVHEVNSCEEMSLVRRDEFGRIIVKTPLVYHEDLSFAHSAAAFHHVVRNELIRSDMGERLPLSNNPTIRFIEDKAQESLGLKAGMNFIAIPRRRIIDGKVAAIHRVYLDPSRFPHGFLAEHDFENESMIHIYAECGYDLVSRDTALRARVMYSHELYDFGLQRNAPYTQPVLDAQQKLWATDPKSGGRFVLEFLQATYLEWEYVIINRPPPRAP